MLDKLSCLLCCAWFISSSPGEDRSNPDTKSRVAHVVKDLSSGELKQYMLLEQDELSEQDRMFYRDTIVLLWLQAVVPVDVGLELNSAVYCGSSCSRKVATQSGFVDHRSTANKARQRDQYKLFPENSLQQRLI